MSDVPETTFSITTEAGDEDNVTIPTGLVELFAEDGQEPAEVLGDIALLSFASRAHHIVHHEDGEDIEAEEARAMELFEERFGVSYAEATGHQH